MVVVRRGQAAQNHLDGLSFRLPGVPPACHGHGLDLCEWISRAASLTDVQSKNERMEFDVSLSVYDITVPVMVHGVNVMDAISTTPKHSSGPRDMSLEESLASGSRPT